jgi:uncharacterized protein YebE (UPF0316 family)
MLIEEKISFRLTSVRIITKEGTMECMHYLRSPVYGVTSIDGKGATGKVKMVFIKRQELPHVAGITLNRSTPMHSVSPGTRKIHC